MVIDNQTKVLDYAIYLYQIKFKSNYLSMKLSFSFSILFLFHKYITTITINDIRYRLLMITYILYIYIKIQCIQLLYNIYTYYIYLFTIRKNAIHIKSDINIISTINVYNIKFITKNNRKKHEI